jgi:hypothetical protein
MYLRTCESYKSAKPLGPQITNPQISVQIRKSQKIFGPQIANPQRATFSEGWEI